MTNLILPTANVTTCNPKLKQEPWHFDAPMPAHYGPGSSQDDVIPPNTPVNQPLPSFYRMLSEDQLAERIRGERDTR